MPIEPGPELLRDWIARAAQRHPAKPWIVSADDGRTITYRELHEATGRIAACLHSRGIGANHRVALLANNSIEHLLCYFGVMSHGATICTVHVEMNRNQLDNIFARLKPMLVLHQDGLGLDDLLSSRRGAEHAARTLRPAGPRDILCRGRRPRAEPAADLGGAGRRCGDPVHVGHERAAQGRGAELSRALGQHRSRRRRLRHHGGRPRVRFPIVQLGLGAAPGRAGAGQPRRHPGHDGEILRQPLLPSHPRSPRHRRRRQPDHDQHPAQHRGGCAS